MKESMGVWEYGSEELTNKNYNKALPFLYFNTFN